MELIRGKKLLKQIFAENWPEFVKQHPGIRPSINKNVEKMLLCGTQDLGFHLYRCPKCGKEKKIPHTCKSGFCPSCGVAQTDIWIEKYTTLFANTHYQHLIFHTPSEFRPFFALGRTPYFNAPYPAVSQTIKDWGLHASYLPGCMLIMHTFGRDCKFSPHIHLLLSCGGLDKTQTRWIICNFLPQAYLKQHFRDHFIQNIQNCWTKQVVKTLPESFKRLFESAYQKEIITKLLKVTRYVHIGERLSNAVFTVRYIGRYTKRPAVAESRITAYDGRSVTFNFVDRQTGAKTFQTLRVDQFISKLIRHIPDQNFRIIRYGGFYSNRLRGKLLPKVFTLLNQNYEKAKEKLVNLSSWWRYQIQRFTKLDPLVRPSCLSPLIPVGTVYPSQRLDSS